MALSSNDIRLAQRLLATRPADTALSLAAERLATHFSIGRRHGRRIRYESSDFERAANLLKAAGIGIEQVETGSTRAERVATAGLSEKSGSRKPSEDSVAIKGVAGALVPTLNGREIVSNSGCYQVMTVEMVCRVTCDVLMIVENLETFRLIDRYVWLPLEGLRVLVIYRGDAATSPADSARLLQARTEPVWWFGDFDPAGLGMAAQMPRLAKVVLPSFTWLESACMEGRRADLFANSLQQWRGQLDQDRRELIAEVWGLMSRLGLGLPQEWMERADAKEAMGLIGLESAMQQLK